MKPSVIALDFDGTIARNGTLEREMGRAIAEARTRGIFVVLVTGRILSELQRVFGDLERVDAVVAENGAVMTFPGSGYTVTLGPAPSAALLAALAGAGIPHPAGQCLVDTDAHHAERILGISGAWSCRSRSCWTAASARLRAADDRVLDGDGPTAVAGFIRGLLDAHCISVPEQARGAWCSDAAMAVSASPSPCAGATCSRQATRSRASRG